MAGMSDNNKKKEYGTYQCASCSTVLFNVSDMTGSKLGPTIFGKPIDEARLQFKKEPDARGELEMRCGTCKRTIGHLLPNGSYRAALAALSLKPSERIEIFEEVKEKIEAVQDAVDQTPNKDDPFDSAQGRQPYSLTAAL